MFTRLTFLLLLSLATGTHAATITVTTAADEVNSDGNCSLREAITAANTDTAISGCSAGSGDDVIILPADVYSIDRPGSNEDANDSGDFDITSNITLVGAGAAATVITTSKPDRIFHLHSGAVLGISDVTIQGGNSVTLGGGLYVYQASLSLDGSIVTANSADQGGGIAYQEGVTLALHDTTVSSNTATSVGGGLYTPLGGQAYFSNVTVSGNRASDGGGIYTRQTAISLSNSTLSGNSADNGGGGLLNQNTTVELLHVTVAANTATLGGGIAASATGVTTVLQNSIIAGNSGGNCSGNGFSSSGYNLSNDATCNLVGSGDLPGTAADLDVLSYNGGATHTHALQSVSAAIDAIPNGANGCGSGSDQRGVTRPHQSGLACDMGAYEYLPNICTVYPSTDIPKDIPDNGSSGDMETSLVTIIDGATISDVNVLDVTGTHVLVSDLSFTLTSPAGTVVPLFSTACSDRDFALSFDDDAAAGNWPCAPTDGGTYQPDGNLSDFDGENSAGAWQLDINDSSPANKKGQLTGWSLEVCTGTVLWIDDASLNEGGGSMTFHLSLSTASAVDILVDYTTVDATAVAGSDYSAISGTLTIPAGDTSATLSVPVTEDSFYEINETFTLQLSNAVNVYLLDDSATGTITDNDPVPAWVCNTYSGGGTGKIPASGNQGTVDYTLNVGDYIIIGDVNVLDLSGTHDKVGDLRFSLRSPAGTGVDLFGPVCGWEENFALSLDDQAAPGAIPCPPTDSGTYQASGDLGEFGGEIANSGSGDWTLRIEDLYSSNSGRLNNWQLQICRLALSVADVMVNEAAGTMDFTVSLNGLSKTDVTVDYITQSGSALAGSDFSAVTGTLTIPAGATAGIISVPIINDSEVENCETLTLVLSNPVGALLMPGATQVEALGYIEDDDGSGSSGLGGSPAWTLDGSNGEWFGFAVTHGDFNGDGFDDVAVGAQARNSGSGQVTVYYGPDLATTTVLPATQAGEQFGHALGSADVNNDGNADLIVGAHLYANGETSEGRAYVYHGTGSGLNTSAAWAAEGDVLSALFGYAVAGAGDVNGDGYDDVIIGAKNYRNGFEFNEGGAFVYHGSATGLSGTSSADADWMMEGGMVIAWLGSAVAGAGDVNNDGYDDVVIGAPGYNFFRGAAFVFHGSASGLSGAADWAITSANSGEQYGVSVAGAGDVNGDGFADVIIGGYGYANGETREGRAEVYHGGAGGLSASADWSAEGDSAFLMFGYSVHGAGDVNNDGYADVIVGGNYQEFAPGEVRVYHGSTAGLNSTADWSQTGLQTTAGFGDAVAPGGDIDGNGYADVLLGVPKYNHGTGRDGRVYVFSGAGGGGGCMP